MVPLEYQVEFSKVRYLTPRQFVEKLSQELRVTGVVAGTRSFSLFISTELVLQIITVPALCFSGNRDEHDRHAWQQGLYC
jgi:hypothetical protein